MGLILTSFGKAPAWDVWTFRLINDWWSNPLFDLIMPVLTDLHKHIWFSAVLAPLLLALWFYKWRRQMLPCLAALIAAVALADSLNHRVLKPTFQRIRPVHSLENVQLRTNVHSGFSFPSNHAANNFAGGVLLFLLFRGYRFRWLFLATATLIAYSRVYVGIHWPLDVFVGGLVGSALGYLIYFVMARRHWLPPIALKRTSP